jgi:hypothetical protein
MDDQFNGIILYYKKDNGDLIGVWTNEMAEGETFDENAIKLDNVRGISGNYSSSWSDIDGAHNGDLRISRRNGLEKVFLFEWFENSRPVFEGVGYEIGNQLIVKYWAN